MRFITILYIMAFWCMHLAAQQPGGVPTPVLWKQSFEIQTQGNMDYSGFNYHLFKKLDADHEYIRMRIQNLKAATLFMVFSQDNSAVFADIAHERGHKMITDTSVISGTELKYKAPLQKAKFLMYSEKFDHSSGPPQHNFLNIGDATGAARNVPEGNIAEVILYDRILSTAERQQIETYLSIKYGISLPEASDYVQSDGTVLRKSAAHGEYNHRVTGVFRDNGSNLYQKQSKNIDDTLHLTIGLEGIYELNVQNQAKLADRSGLIWADNGLSSTFEKTSNPWYHTRMNRIWKMNTYTQDTAVLRYQIKVSHMAAYTDAYPVWLVVMPDGSSQNRAGAKYIKMTKSIDGTYHTCEQKWSSLTRGDWYFTFEQGPEAAFEISQDPNSCDGKTARIDVNVIGLGMEQGMLEISAGGTLLHHMVFTGAGAQSLQLEYGDYDVQQSMNQMPSMVRNLKVAEQLCRGTAEHCIIKPNPIKADDLFSIIDEIGNDGVTAKTLGIQIYDNAGKLLQSQVYQAGTTIRNVYPAGVYNVKIKAPGIDKQCKMVVF